MKINHLSLLHRPLMFLAPDTGGAGGGKPTLSIEDQLTAARSEVTTFTGQLASLTTELDSLQSQFTALSTTATALRSDLTDAQGQVTSLTAERDTARTGLTSAGENITRLESLCGVKGIAKDAATPSAPAASSAPEGHVFDRHRAAQGTEKTRLWRAHRSEIRAEGERRMAGDRH